MVKVQMMLLNNNNSYKKTEKVMILICNTQFQLLLECGLIRPTTSGFFTILPLAKRALDKLEQLVHSCLETVQAQRMLLPCLTSANLWQRTGRLDSVGSELFVMKDRHDKKYLLAPVSGLSIHIIILENIHIFIYVMNNF